ncbi:MAG TPA: peptide chain release factor N(5)-glutamine methyltransferase [Candidatus Acidoferrales bacterium]|nr:peptide chain release factor N(5)-glutamine methyltransferase [Candidatus Acidoferrales bacterium]
MQDAVVPAMNIRSALREAMGRLESAGVPSHALAAELLLMHALNRDRTWLYSHPEDEISPATREQFYALIAQRADGVPTQYLTGKQEFWGLDFEVTPAVLIPRPETEHVIEVTVDRLGAERKNNPLQIADIGTGSGCIAVALAHELRQAEIVATDISREALEVAKRNSARHNATNRIRFIESNLFEALREESPKFDVIVSNPPYIPLREAPQLQREVRAHEPPIALFAGEDGLAVFAPLIRDARDLLKPRGLLVLELGHNSLRGVKQVFKKSSAWNDVRVTNDLAGIPRVISGLRADV